jgi:hypothetical protein
MGRPSGADSNLKGWKALELGFSTGESSKQCEAQGWRVNGIEHNFSIESYTA